jgi:hypothetical protein
MNHDSWANLKVDSPFEPILEKFPNGMPLRDPFPSIFVVDPNTGISVTAWEIDLSRLDFNQSYSLAAMFAGIDNYADAIKQGIALNNNWIESVRVGVEGFNRALEFAAFLESVPNPEVEDLQDFLVDQEERWVRGFEVPDLSKIPSETVDVRALSDKVRGFYYQLENPRPLEDVNSKVVGLVDTDISPERESIIIKARGASILELSNLRLGD